MWRSARILAIPAALGAAAVGAAQSSPTENFLRQQRLINDQLTEQRQNMAPAEALVDWQWGGWIEYYVFHFDDGVQSSRLYQRPGLAVWSKLSIDDGAHEFFVRIRENYDRFKHGDQYDRRVDWDGPKFDRAWYEINLAKALKLDADPLDAKFRVGRQAVLFGAGYALDLPLDAVTMDLHFGDWRINGLLGRTIPSLPNIDRSAPVQDHSYRQMYGGQLTYEGFNRHRPFVYALWNNDKTDERPQTPFQNYSYDTRYFGAGSQGEIAKNLTYWAEAVYEGGRSYGTRRYAAQSTVDAYGWDLGLEYRFEGPAEARLSGEYMFASGDGDRLFSPTNSGSNRFGKDTSFNGFGYRDTGISASPALSNVHIWRLGGAARPLHEVEWLRDLEVGANTFLYYKHHHRAAISDSTADMFNGYVGWEFDTFLNWRIASDLSWTVRYGAFFPGKAFSDRETRHFVLTGVTWSF
ncbi:MAG: alginate export family protein [Phycisphaerales bacterium]|nr:alginate export family protein [Phycisphaerales bacterium]